MEMVHFWMGSTKEWLSAPATNGTLVVAAVFLAVAFQNVFRELRAISRQSGAKAKLTLPELLK
jgi:uncharacterized membrane protein YqhA